jgi:hypothetical protein
MQAGVPIVPVVIRNAGAAMWKGSPFIRKGTVDVAEARANPDEQLDGR